LAIAGRQPAQHPLGIWVFALVGAKSGLAAAPPELSWGALFGAAWLRHRGRQIQQSKQPAFRLESNNPFLSMHLLLLLVSYMLWAP
jgi:hypothetical protein